MYRIYTKFLRSTARCFDLICSARSAHANQFPHEPVLKNELVQLLDPKSNQTVLDMTFGTGGHTRALLDSAAGLTCYCMDRDPTTEVFVEQTRRLYDGSRATLISLRGKFSDLPDLCRTHGLKPNTLDMIIMDLGVSSLQLDSSTRGFSYKFDDGLDMRMDQSDLKAVTAFDVVNTLDAATLAAVFKLYGEERAARRVANAIVDYRHTIGHLRSTKQLADIVLGVIPYTGGTKSRRSSSISNTHPASRIFQALRIFVNDELNELCCGLELAQHLLKSQTDPHSRGGRLAVISFHSLEDRLVKWAFTNDLDTRGCLSQTLADLSNAGRPGFERRRSLLRQLSLIDRSLCDPVVPRWTKVTGPLVPTEAEILANPRSRSAKLRVAEKI